MRRRSCSFTSFSATTWETAFPGLWQRAVCFLLLGRVCWALGTLFSDCIASATELLPEPHCGNCTNHPESRSAGKSHGYQLQPMVAEDLPPEERTMHCNSSHTNSCDCRSGCYWGRLGGPPCAQLLTSSQWCNVCCMLRSSCVSATTACTLRSLSWCAACFVGSLGSSARNQQHAGESQPQVSLQTSSAWL